MHSAVTALTEERDAQAEDLLAAAEREADLNEQVAKAQKGADKLLEKQKALVKEREADQALAMEKRLKEFEGAAEERQALLEQQAKEERIELLRRQMIRRLTNQGIIRGWQCWAEFASGRSYALGKLREVGSRLRSPALASAFHFWCENQIEVKQAALLAAREREKKSLEGTLRQTRFEMAQLSKIRVAQDDEITAAKKQLAELTEEVRTKNEMLVDYAASKKEAAEFKELYNLALEDVAEAESRASVAEGEESSQREQSEALLKRLLEEQRAGFDEERAQLKEQLEAKTEQQEKEARIETLRKAAGRRIQNQAITRGFVAWTELWEAKIYALGTLRRIAGKLSVKGVAAAYDVWLRRYKATLVAQREAAKDGEIGDMASAFEGLTAELETTKGQLASMTAQRDALRQKLSDAISGNEPVDVEGLLAEQAEAEKEKRIDLLKRQITRRIMNADISRGFTAWLDFWEATTSAKERLAKIAGHMKFGEVASVFTYWSLEVEETRGSEARKLSMNSVVGLRAEVDKLRSDLLDVREDKQRLIADRELAIKAALERQLIELTGTAEEQAAMLAEAERENRIELMKRQAMRRMLAVGLSTGFHAWLEMYDAKTYAHSKLKEIANRLRKPEVAFVFNLFIDNSNEAKRKKMQIAQLEAKRREAGLQSEYSDLNCELERLRAEYEQKLLDKEREKKQALERQLLELTGSAEELLALEKEKEKEGRVEMLRKSAARRILFSGLAAGWQAWTELYEARSYAMRRLREVGNTLQCPSTNNYWQMWLEDLAEAKQAKQRADLEAQSKTLEAQLRHSRFELGQLKMVKVAQDEELSALRSSMHDLNESMSSKGSKLADLSLLPRENERLTEVARVAEAAAREATELREEAERDIIKKVEANKDLLEKLLADQRRKFIDESCSLRENLSKETEKRQTFEAEAAHHKEEVERVKLEHKEDMARLRKEVERLGAPAPKPAKPAKKTGILQIDLDEGPLAKPISDQLAEALRSNSTRVLDLFRSWDTDGDGEVSRAEFQKAMPALGLDVAKHIIDDLFSSWDTDGGGSLSYNELAKILRKKPGPGAPMAAAVTVNKAAEKLKKNS